MGIAKIIYINAHFPIGGSSGCRGHQAKSHCRVLPKRPATSGKLVYHCTKLHVITHVVILCCVQSAWERERREKGNALTVLLATWIRVHKQGEERPSRPSRVAKGDDTRDTVSSSSGEEDSAVEESSAEMEDSDGKDIVEDFRLSSDESD